MSAAYEEPQFAANFNLEGKGELANVANMMGMTLVSRVYESFREFQLEDIYERSRENLGSYLLWLSHDIDQVRVEEGEDFKSSASFALQDPSDSSQRLRFHVPIPTGFNMDSIEAVEALPLPKEICAERVLVSGLEAQTVTRIAVGIYGSSKYLTSSDTQTEQELHPDILTELHAKYNPGIDVISQLSAHLYDWRAIKQRLVEVDGDSIDLI